MTYIILKFLQNSLTMSSLRDLRHLLLEGAVLHLLQLVLLSLLLTLLLLEGEPLLLGNGRLSGQFLNAASLLFLTHGVESLEHLLALLDDHPAVEHVSVLSHLGLVVVLHQLVHHLVLFVLKFTS